MKPRTVIVECTFQIAVEIPDYWILCEDDEDGENAVIRYMIEGHCCPATGEVGNVVDDLIEKSGDGQSCWACQFKRGTNKIVDWHPK